MIDKQIEWFRSQRRYLEKYPNNSDIDYLVDQHFLINAFADGTHSPQDLRNPRAAAHWDGWNPDMFRALANSGAVDNITPAERLEMMGRK